MVKMSIDKIEITVGYLVVEQGPSGRAAASRIPSQRRLERSLGEPVSSPLFQLYTLSVIKDGHMLAIMDTVLPADPDTFVTRAVLNEVIQLEIKSFLHTENSGFLV